MLFLFSLLILFNRCRERSFAVWGLDYTTGWLALCSGQRLHQDISPGSSSRLSGPQPGCFAVRRPVSPGSPCSPAASLGTELVFSIGTGCRGATGRAAASEQPAPFLLPATVPRGPLAETLVWKPRSPSQVPALPPAPCVSCLNHCTSLGLSFPFFRQCCTESSAAPGILEVQGGPGRTSTSWRDAASAEGPPPPPAG